MEQGTMEMEGIKYIVTVELPYDIACRLVDSPMIFTPRDNEDTRRDKLVLIEAIRKAITFTEDKIYAAHNQH